MSLFPFLFVAIMVLIKINMAKTETTKGGGKPDAEAPKAASRTRPKGKDEYDMFGQRKVDLDDRRGDGSGEEAAHTKQSLWTKNALDFLGSLADESDDEKVSEPAAGVFSGSVTQHHAVHRTAQRDTPNRVNDMMKDRHAPIPQSSYQQKMEELKDLHRAGIIDQGEMYDRMKRIPRDA
jgi:hypothetical protein